MGVARGLYWSLTLPCASVEWEGEEWETSLACEWLRWPVRNWTQLNGASLVSAVHPEEAECSFYFAEHHPVKLEALSIVRVQGTLRFQVQARGSLDLNGHGHLDGREIQFSLEGEAEFEGLIVVPDNLFPKPINPLEASAALSPFIDLDNFEPPEWDRFRYVLAPTASDA